MVAAVVANAQLFASSGTYCIGGVLPKTISKLGISFWRGYSYSMTKAIIFS